MPLQRLRLPLHLALIALAALMAFVPPPWAANAAAQAPQTFDLRDFGAAGDGTTDDAPALQAALDALAAAGGGTLHVPAGRYVIASPVHKDFAGLAVSITIRGVSSETIVDTTGTPTQLANGLGLVSEFYPRTREAHVALHLKGLGQLLVTDIAFVGTPGVTTDAASVVTVEDVPEAIVRHCEFYGLSTLVGAVVHARRSGLHVEQTKFLGTVANSGIYAPVVDNLEWKSVALTDVVFLDYGLRPELFGKTGFGAPYSWVNVGNAAAVTADSPRREVSIRRVFLDEGGYVGLSSLPFRYQPATAPVDLYYVTGLRMNVSNLRTTGNYFDGLDALLVENSRYGWSHNADSAIYVLRSGHVIFSHVHTEAAATRLRADASVGSLTVIDSVYQDLASQAGATRVIETEEEADDPVRHVRERFVSVVGREPDPAAHYYWSRRLLACAEGDAACTTSARAALEGYLAQAPAPKFAIEGVVSDEQGGALAGVTLTLNGSQAVSTVTDAAGRYRFSNLPTSGVYTVTAAKPHHTFVPGVKAIVTPAGDQAVNFTSTASNPIDETAFFVRQHYLDFLNREPDPAGLAFWVAGIESCGMDAECRQVKRVDTSAAFFLSIEFQETGLLSILTHQAAFGRRPLYGEFMVGTQALQRDVVFGTPGANEQLEANKQTFFDDFVNKPEFRDRYPATLTNEQYVDALLATAGLTPSEVRLFVVEMTNAQEVPPAVPTATGGGPRPASFGTARLHFNEAQTAAVFTSTVFNIDFTGMQTPDETNDDLTIAHIHASATVTPMTTAPVVWGFFGTPFNDNNPNDQQVIPFSSGVGGQINGKWDAPEGNGTTLADQLANIREGRAYVNFHTVQFPGGEIRGNIPAADAFRNSLVAGLGDMTLTRAQVLRRVAEAEELKLREFNAAFVLMEYFGYLRRDPDTGGFNFWLDKLNAFNGDFRAAEMVRAFIESIEYRQRFGQ